MAIASAYTLLSDTPSPKECYKCDGSVTDFLKMFHQFMVMNEWTPRWCWTTIFEVPHVTLYLVWTKMAHGSGNLPQEGKTTCWIGHFWGCDRLAANKRSAKCRAWDLQFFKTSSWNAKNYPSISILYPYMGQNPWNPLAPILFTAQSLGFPGLHPSKVQHLTLESPSPGTRVKGWGTEPRLGTVKWPHCPALKLKFGTCLGHRFWLMVKVQYLDCFGWWVSFLWLHTFFNTRIGY